MRRTQSIGALTVEHTLLLEPRMHMRSCSFTHSHVGGCLEYKEEKREPTRSSVRWAVLLLSCWIMFGNYYAFDNPSALATLLRKWMATDETMSGSMRADEFQFQFNLLYAVYSVPNIALPLITGRLVERGTRLHRIILWLSFFVCVGQAIVGWGTACRSWTAMQAGRLVFGVGGESLAVAQARLVTFWFDGKGLALAIGLTLSVARLGTVINNSLSPWVAQRWSVPAAMWTGFLFCLISVMCTVLCCFIDYKYRECEEPVAIESSDRFSVHYAFWMLLAVCFLNNCCMVPYNNIASEYLQRRFFPDDLTTANAFMSIPDFMAIALVPLFGVFVDKSRRTLDVILAGSMLFAIGHWLLGGRGKSPLIALSFLGVAYSTMLAFWPAVPLLVKSDRGQAIAFGLLTSAFNAAVSVVPLILPKVISADPDEYSWVSAFFTGIAALSVLITLAVYVTDRRCRLRLNSPVHVAPIIIVE